MREITSKEMEELEKRHRAKVTEVAGEVGKRLGRDPKEIEEHIHSHIEKLPNIHRLEAKRHFIRIATPIMTGFLVTAMTGLHPEPMVLYGAIIGGFILGQIEAHEIEKKIVEAERHMAERVKGKLHSVI